MTRSVLHSPTAIWLLLLACTGVSFAIFEGQAAATITGPAVVLIAAIKSRMVILHYMEAKRVSANWRRMYETWNFATAALLIVANVVTLRQFG